MCNVCFTIDMSVIYVNSVNIINICGQFIYSSSIITIFIG